ncbi:MAG: hypothetical protein ACD_50C00333G0005 [uncultured bacterium]|nr:MAG: hypothetical protein ACD_50C00333G0005 [uncultured bacterium]OGH13814.1 MAG: UDP-N-acetylenolpyruvoylglucosamine reductase [Candidatus Levybacteria bacterium RIFCSPHIGHO2_01_FULL_38_26]
MFIYNDFLLSEILYYKIGGKAKVLLKIEKKEDLFQALDFIKKEKTKKILPLGLGSNILINDKFFDGVVLWFSMYQAVPGRVQSSGIKLIDDNVIEAFASEDLDDLIKFSFKNNLLGLEWAGGLPSTIGGAVRGNVGAFGGEIAGCVDAVEVFEVGQDGRFDRKLLKASELEFGYRDSLIKRSKDLLVVSATFKLQKASKEDIEKAKEVYQGHIEYRNKNHPMEYPSCGSVFKNVIKKEEVGKILNVWGDVKDLVENKWYNKASMGYIIDRLGFSGFAIGGAKVSEKHANYIVNFDNAKFSDVYSIIEKIKEKFYETFGFYPDPEVQIVS